MSKLRVAGDDHADAAGKHVADARALLDNHRYDGAGYLSGYVVECALKAVILHDKSFDPHAGSHDAIQLASWHRELSKRPYGHNLQSLAACTVGTEGARYLPDLPPTASIFAWRETLRYSPSGAMSEGKASELQRWAELAYTQSVLAMRADGVI